MKIASVADVKSHLSAYVKESQHGPVVVTRNGKAVAVLLAVTDEDELERLILAHSPKFQAILSKSRKQIEKTGGIPHDVFWPKASVEQKGATMVARKITRQDALARIGERSGDPLLTNRNTHFANVNRKKNVWWLEVPLRKVSPFSKANRVHFLLYDHQTDQLHHLAVPVEYLLKNRNRLVIRDRKVCLELSADQSQLFRDERPKSDHVSFAQFRQSTI